MKPMKLIWLAQRSHWRCAGKCACARPPLRAPGNSPRPRSPSQIAAILGPGQAHLTIRNLSTIPNDEIPAIRRLLVQDLKAHGVMLAGAESANIDSRDAERERARAASGWPKWSKAIKHRWRWWIWDRFNRSRRPTDRAALMLAERSRFLTSHGSGAAVWQRQPAGLVVLERIADRFCSRTQPGWLQRQKRVTIDEAASWREIREEFLHGRRRRRWIRSIGSGNRVRWQLSPPAANARATGRHSGMDSDDPWPIAHEPWRSSLPPIRAPDGQLHAKAFYNSVARLLHRSGYAEHRRRSAAVLLRPRSFRVPPARARLLIGGIDGKVQMAENGALKAVAGTRDWGSDFAALHSGCGAGTQVIASGSGEAASDSLRAYELPALEAIPASAPLAMDGTVTALWTAPDGKSVLAVVRNAANRIRGGPCYGALQLAVFWFWLALPCARRTRPHYGGTLRVEIAGDPWQRSRWPGATAGLRWADRAGRRMAT